MAEKRSKAGTTDEPKRLNRTIALGDAIGPIIGPALRRRGFASRDLLDRWDAIAPKPYNAITRPHELKWPRGTGRSAEGAVLYLKVLPGHALAVQHEAQSIAAAVNRYFGYVLVKDVRLSAEPLAETPARAAPTPPPRSETVDAAVGAVADDGLREALRRLGQGIIGRSRN